MSNIVISDLPTKVPVDTDLVPAITPEGEIVAIEYRYLKPGEAPIIFDTYIRTQADFDDVFYNPASSATTVEIYAGTYTAPEDIVSDVRLFGNGIVSILATKSVSLQRMNGVTITAVAPIPEEKPLAYTEVTQENNNNVNPYFTLNNAPMKPEVDNAQTNVSYTISDI